MSSRQRQAQHHLDTQLSRQLRAISAGGNVLQRVSVFRQKSVCSRCIRYIYDKLTSRSFNEDQNRLHFTAPPYRVDLDHYPVDLQYISIRLGYWRKHQPYFGNELEKLMGIRNKITLCRLSGFDRSKPHLGEGYHMFIIMNQNGKIKRINQKN